LFFSDHVIITITIYIMSYMFLSYPLLIIPFFIGGVLIDFDHCYDYYLRYRKPIFSVSELGNSLAPYHHFILPFHSYEFMFVVLLTCILIPNPIIISFAFGYSLHMALDITFNRYESVQALSLVYRITNWWDDVYSNTG
jgi:hypothetical protein